MFRVLDQVFNVVDCRFLFFFLALVEAPVAFYKHHFTGIGKNTNYTLSVISASAPK